MKRIAITLPRTIGILTLLTLMAACGGGGGSEHTASSPPLGDDPGNDGPPPSAVQGVATPSNIAVVTATNAN